MQLGGETSGFPRFPGRTEAARYAKPSIASLIKRQLTRRHVRMRLAHLDELTEILIEITDLDRASRVSR